MSEMGLVESITGHVVDVEVSPPPGFTEAADDQFRVRCSTCANFNGGTRCTKYDYPVRVDTTCDTWESNRTEGGRLRLSDDAKPDGSHHAGGTMIALYPEPEIAAQIAVEGGLPAEDIHLTLAYLGTEPPKYPLTLLQRLEDVARSRPPVLGTLTGNGSFTAGDEDCAVALVDSPSLVALASELRDTLRWSNMEADDQHGFLPHMTLKYGGESTELPPLDLRFDAIYLVAGGEKTRIPFGEKPEEDEAVMHLSDESPTFELFLSSEAVEIADGLIWKEALREGTFIPVDLPDKTGQIRRVPLRVVDGHSDDPTKAIGLDDIIQAHDDRLFDHVTIPWSHDDLPHQNTGYVDRMLKFTRPDGKVAIKSGLRFTKKDVEESVRDKSIANVSCGLRFFQQHHETGKIYPVSAAHVALTNKPWVPGMSSFDASDDRDPVSLMLADEAKLDLSEIEGYSRRLKDGTYVRVRPHARRGGGIGRFTAITADNPVSENDHALSEALGDSSDDTVVEDTMRNEMAAESARYREQDAARTEKPFVSPYEKRLVARFDPDEELTRDEVKKALVDHFTEENKFTPTMRRDARLTPEIRAEDILTRYEANMGGNAGPADGVDDQEKLIADISRKERAIVGHERVVADAGKALGMGKNSRQFSDREIAQRKENLRVAKGKLETARKELDDLKRRLGPAQGKLDMTDDVKLNLMRQVSGYTRKLKNGKTVRVKQHARKGDVVSYQGKQGKVVRAAEMTDPAFGDHEDLFEAEVDFGGGGTEWIDVKGLQQEDDDLLEARANDPRDQDVQHDLPEDTLEQLGYDEDSGRIDLPHGVGKGDLPRGWIRGVIDKGDSFEIEAEDADDGTMVKFDVPAFEGAGEEDEMPHERDYESVADPLAQRKAELRSALDDAQGKLDKAELEGDEIAANSYRIQRDAILKMAAEVLLAKNAKRNLSDDPRRGSNTDTTGGDPMGTTTAEAAKPKPAEDPEREKMRLDLDRQNQEIERLRKQLHENDVEKKAEEMQKSLPPGFCKEARALMLADQGAPVLKLDLSDGGGERQMTVTDVVEKLAATLSSDESREHYRSQIGGVDLSDDTRPADGNEEMTIAQRAAAIRAETGFGDAVPTNTKDEG